MLRLIAVLLAAGAFVGPDGVSVAPDGGSAAFPASSQGNLDFEVHNTGGTQQTFIMECVATGSTRFCNVDGQVVVQGNSSESVEVSFATRSPGSGDVTLIAGNQTVGWDEGYYTVDVQ